MGIASRRYSLTEADLAPGAGPRFVACSGSNADPAVPSRRRLGRAGEQAGRQAVPADLRLGGPGRSAVLAARRASPSSAPKASACSGALASPRLQGNSSRSRGRSPPARGGSYSHTGPADPDGVEQGRPACRLPAARPALPASRRRPTARAMAGRRPGTATPGTAAARLPAAPSGATTAPPGRRPRAMARGRLAGPGRRRRRSASPGAGPGAVKRASVCASSARKSKPSARVGRDGDPVVPGRPSRIVPPKP